MLTVSERVAAEPYWFLRMDLGNGIVTPGWSDPAREKLPYFGLPEDMSGLRVLDVACAEGFFSFEAERRGAAEVVSVDFDPECIKRFGICSDALGSSIRPQVMSVYDLDPQELGTFDLVMFFGLLYHLPNPLLGVEKVAAMTSGTLLVQSRTLEIESLADVPLAQFWPDGIISGPPGNPVRDPTVYWDPNAACIAAMLAHVGMVNIERLNPPPQSFRRSIMSGLRRGHSSPRYSSAQFRSEASA
jgi:tRNA (mo5U34)-methyltransferase